MTRRPETRYAWNSDVVLAYQVFGAGPVDLVYVQGYRSSVDLNWESPYLTRFLRGLGERAGPHRPPRLGLFGPVLAGRRRAPAARAL